MAPLTDEMATVWVRRVIAAETDRVFNAWLSDELLMRWLAPAGLWATRAEAYARVGGRFRLWYADTHGDAGGIEARFLALETNRRMVLRWGLCGPERLAGPIHDTLLSVRLRPVGDGSTYLTLAHENLQGLRLHRPDQAERLERDWLEALAQLEDVLAL